MSRVHQVERHLDREEERLLRDYNEGLITREDYNAGLRELHQEARDAYQADMDDAAERVRDEWGGW